MRSGNHPSSVGFRHGTRDWVSLRTTFSARKPLPGPISVSLHYRAKNERNGRKSPTPLRWFSSLHRLSSVSCPVQPEWLAMSLSNGRAGGIEYRFAPLSRCESAYRRPISASLRQTPFGASRPSFVVLRVRFIDHSALVIKP
jgi:hypothetical protein